VFRVAVLYAAAGWLVLQVTDVLASLLDWPKYVGKLVVLLVAIGLPLALAIAWGYELTPEGLKKDSEVAADAPSRRQGNRKLNAITVGIALLAIAAILLARLLPPGVVPNEVADRLPAAAVEPETQAPKAVAVLPFVNLSSDAEQEFFSDGVTEEIINLLAGVDGLRVTSRTSAFSFKGQSLDVATIAGKLGVGYIVEGSVRRAGDRVRISAQLIDVAADQHLWSESYERTLDDVFAIQSDVAGQVARVLRIALGAEELASIGRAPTASLDAWQKFLKARYQLRNRTSPSDIREAAALVDAAIEDDPQFARAHSLRALILLLTPVWESGRREFEMQRSSGVTEAEIARLEADWVDAIHETDVALQLDPRLGEPHAVRALYAQARNLYTDARRSFRWALSRAPSDPDIRNWYGSFLLETGYLQAGLSEKLRAAELDPLSPIIAWQLAYAGLLTGRVDLMVDFSRKARENGWPGWEGRVIDGGAALYGGDIDEAERRFVRALPERERQIRMSLAAIRRHEIDEPTAHMLASLEPYGPPGLGRFVIEVAAGDVDAALATIYGTIDPTSLRRPDDSGGPARPAAGSRPGSVLRGDWWFRSTAALRRDPRFAELVRAVGLVEFWRDAGWPDACEPQGDGVVCQ
jgi:TolB-like protein/Tfp pilus assembly protein PilF